ncbi:hypothetical protein ARMGADRAFT_881258, partial [Armillaria gallica]
LRKLEAWINTFTPLLTYLFQCNTDVTSLRSGTAIKAVISYVSDYVTKPALKTHVIFEAIRSVFERNVKLLSSGETRKEKARKLIAKIVNVLGVKMEIGSPFIYSYLLGIPDHYTNKKFVVCFWQNYVSYIRKAWNHDDTHIASEKVLIRKHKGSLIGVSVVEDYAYRPDELTCLSLYDWICLSEKISLIHAQMKKNLSGMTYLYQDETPVAPDDTNDDITDSLAKEFSNAFRELGDIIEAFQPRKPDPESLKGSYSFQKEHPLSSTHHVVCRGILKAYVPNFVGSVLPRHDHGDNEYY